MIDAFSKYPLGATVSLYCGTATIERVGIIYRDGKPKVDVHLRFSDGTKARLTGKYELDYIKEIRSANDG